MDNSSVLEVLRDGAGIGRVESLKGLHDGIRTSYSILDMTFQ